MGRPQGSLFLGEGRLPEGKCSSVCCFAAVMISSGCKRHGSYDLWHDGVGYAVDISN